MSYYTRSEFEQDCEIVSSDDETKCESPSMSRSACDMQESLLSIEYFGSGLSHSCNEQHFSKMVDQLKWTQSINFLVQLHYDMGPPALKPNVLSLCAEYLAYLTKCGCLELDALHVADDDVRRSLDIRMALFEAVKYDQGFQMSVAKLFDLHAYPQPMVLSNSKAMLEQRTRFAVYVEHQFDAAELENARTTQQLIDWLRVKEVEFCKKIDWNFSFSTRFQTLMMYLKRLALDVDGVVSREYKNVKIAYNSRLQRQSNRDAKQVFSDDVKLGFLCRYLLEMSYYKAFLYAVAKKDVAIAIIYAACVIAQRWTDNFDFERLMANRRDMYRLMDDKHPRDDPGMYQLIRRIIRMGRQPQWCFERM